MRPRIFVVLVALLSVALLGMTPQAHLSFDDEARLTGTPNNNERDLDPKPPKTRKPTEQYQPSEEEIELMARVIYAEAGVEPVEELIAVGAVVLNRVENSHFPNTVRDVIYQPGQFESVGNEWFNSEPPEVAVYAAREAFKGVDPSQGALFFFNPNKTRNRFLWSRPVTVHLGGHRFTK